MEKVGPTVGPITKSGLISVQNFSNKEVVQLVNQAGFLSGRPSRSYS